MNYDPFDHNVLVVGDSGSGKTNFVKWFVKSLPSNVPWWVWDYNHQYQYPRVVSDASQLAYERTVVQPRDASSESFQRFAAKADATGNIVAVVEEVQEYVTPHRLVGESFFRTGRNRGTTWIAVTQRPAEVASALVSNAHHRVVFRLTHPNDVKFLQRWIHPSMGQAHDLAPHDWLYHDKLVPNPPVKFGPVPLTERL